MLLHNIGPASAILLICWFLFLIITVLAYTRRSALMPYFLFLSAVCMAGSFAALTPFLYPWDEQFHALVGKNLSNNPIFPKLIPHHPLDVSQDFWLNGIVWLHKQPLFTWQMALSVKLFGANAFAVRLPSVLFHGILVITIFRIGVLAFNRKTGFIAALLVLHTSFLLGLISGRTGTDHNDFIFLCYITLSIWAWLEWDLSAKKRWLYWIGIFAGCAILTKWLVGLLIFAGWSGVAISRFPRLTPKLFFQQEIKPFLISLGVCILVFIPWQIYTFLRFPAEAKREMEYNSLHLSEAVENHVGDKWFHYEQLSNLYFERLDFIILFIMGGILLFISQKVRKEHKVFLLVMIVITYLFFTLVKTKMPGFTIPVLGLMLLVIAFGIAEIANSRTGVIASAALTLLIGMWLLKPEETIAYHQVKEDKTQPWGNGVWYRGYVFAQKHGSDSPRRVVFGVNYFDYAHISWMFFNDEIAYPFIPSKDEVEKLQQAGYRVTIVESEANVFDTLAKKDGIEFLRY